MKHKRTHKWAFPLGLLVVVLAVVGAVSLIGSAVRGVQNWVDNPAERRSYEAFLANVVARAPDPFSAPEHAHNPAQLVDIALTALLRREDNTPADFNMDDYGNLVVPQQAVADMFRALFGIDLPHYAALSRYVYDFWFDPVQQAFLVPFAGELVVYVPRVTGINRVGGSVELVVEYLLYEDTNLDEFNQRQELVAVRTMIIRLNEQPGNALASWQIEQIRHPLATEIVAGAPILR
ncbi:MAG: hypothetical protein FWE40_07440 [Oscillospiraceae bacterium]|nr:hypothetical protein [Oscillospiraceae bacterium]